MSIVTLSSTEAFGGVAGGVPEDRAANFQNYFKSPITFHKDDTIQITSVTINQLINEFTIDGTNNEIQYRLGPAADTGTVPFFQLHKVVIPDGTYLPATLALIIAEELNASLTLPMYLFDCQYDTATNKFAIALDQNPFPAAVNTSVNFPKSPTLSGPPPAVLPAYPLARTNPGIPDIFAVPFGIQNNSGYAPTPAEQLALQQPVNINQSCLLDEADPIRGQAYRYRMLQGIHSVGGEHTVQINTSYVLSNLDLITVGGPAASTTVQISNYLNVAADNRQYHASANAAVNLTLTGPYQYKLEALNGWVGYPKALQNLSPDAALGLREATQVGGPDPVTGNSIPSAGTGFVVDNIYSTADALGNSPGGFVPAIIRVTQAGGGTLQKYTVLYPGQGCPTGAGLQVNNSLGSSALITVDATNGRRIRNAGENSVPPAPPLFAVGDVLDCFFPSGTLANPPTPGVIPTFAEMEADGAAIGLKAKVEQVTGLIITEIRFESILLGPHTADFTRLQKVLTDFPERIMMADTGGNITGLSSSVIDLAVANGVEEGTLYFGTLMNGLMGLTDVSTNFGRVGPGGFEIGNKPAVFSGQALNGTTRSYLANEVQPEQIDVDPTSPGFGQVFGAQAMKISRVDVATGALSNLVTQTRQMKVDFTLGLARSAWVAGEAGDPTDYYVAEGMTRDSTDFKVLVEANTQHARNDVGQGGIVDSPSNILTISNGEYAAGEDNLGANTDIVVIQQDLLQVAETPAYDITKTDEVIFTVTDLNTIAVTYTQVAPAVGFTPITHTFFANPGDVNTVREAMFPLFPTFALSQGASVQQMLPSVTVAPGQNYVGIQGKYHEDSPNNATTASEALDSLINENTATFYEAPTVQPTIAKMTGVGLTDLIQTPHLYKFGFIDPANGTPGDNNPVPGVGGAVITSIGPVDIPPNSANTSQMLGMLASANRNDEADPAALPVVTTAPNVSSLGGTANRPNLMVEFPDFNIKGYSGAAADKFQIVAVVPREEWGTTAATTTGTLHYKPLFPLSVDVNLPEDKELYSMNVRVRSLDGKLVTGLKNPTTVTFYKKPRDGLALEKALSRMLQKRSEKQDQAISMRTEGFPMV